MASLVTLSSLVYNDTHRYVLPDVTAYRASHTPIVTSRRFPATLGNVASYAIVGIHPMANYGDSPA